MFRISIRGEEEIRRMARQVADGPDHLRNNLGTAVRRAARPALRDAKKAIATNRIIGYPTGGRRYRGPDTKKGLRAAIAANVDVEINTGSLTPRARFVVRTYRLGNRAKLPEYIDSGERWRHPILGKRSKGSWAEQSGRPWFERSIVRNLPLLERRTNEAVERTARAIAR